jgi:hypothetical protein
MESSECYFWNLEFVLYRDGGKWFRYEMNIAVKLAIDESPSKRKNRPNFRQARSVACVRVYTQIKAAAT